MRHPFATLAVLAGGLILATPALAGEIRGRVLVDGKPGAGVEVAVVPFEDANARARREARDEDAPRPLATTTTARDGTFAVHVDAAAAGAPVVRLSLTGGGTPPVVLGSLVDPAGEDVGDLRVGAASALAGRVLDPSGGPVVGAKVTLLAGGIRRFDDDRTPGEPLPQVTTTDASGTFRFDRAGADGNSIRAEAPAFAVAERTGVRSGALARPMTLEVGTIVRGTVTLPDGRPPAATAVVRFEGHATTRWVESRRDGAFLIEGVPREAGQIVADAGERGRGSAPLAPGSADPVRLVLAPTAGVAGRVVDATSAAPVPGVRLLATGAGAARFLAVSARDGGYAFAALAPGTWRIEADDERFVRGTRTATLTPGQVERLDVPLTRASIVEGRVTDERGMPIEGARVEVRPGAANPFERFRRRIEGGSDSATAVTSRDGSFEVKRVRPGERLQLVVSHDEYENRTIAGLDLAPGATRSGVSVVLRRGLRLSGIVREEEGRPVAGAEVQLSRQMRLESGRRGTRIAMVGPPTQQKRESSSDGRFDFSGLEPGTYSLRARHPGFAISTRERLEVEEGEPDEPVELVMKPGATLSGVVRDRSGNGSAGWMVSARSAGSGGPGPVFGFDNLGSEGPTASDGVFLIEGAVAGETYEVQAMGPAGLGPRLSDVTAPAADLELTVNGTGQVRGQVQDADSGRPVADFEVVYQPDATGGMRFVFRMDGTGRGPYQPQSFHAEDGSFVLDEVPAGRWTVEVRAEGYQKGSLSGVAVEEGGVVEGVDVRLSRGSVLTGQVVESRTGRPVLDATIQAQLSGGERGPRFGPGAREFSASSDADGRFEITGLAPGTWSVTASHPDWSEATASVEISDSPATVDLRLESGGSIGGVVLAGGRPVEGAQVAIDASGETGFRGPFGGQSTLTDPGGRFRFDRLSAGRYELVATLRSQSSSPVEAVVTPDTPQEVSLTLAEGATIRGTVSGLPDALVGSVSVNASGPESYFGNARTGADGGFELTGVPEGLITLNATAGDFVSGSRSARASVTIGPGQTEAFAEIVFEPGFHVEGHVTRGSQPLADAMVFASPEGRGGGGGASGQTDTTGFYSLEGLQEGVYNFVANSMGGGSPIRRTVTLSGDSTVDLEAPPARLVGVVVDSGTGRSLGDVSVHVEDAGGGGGGFRFMSAVSTDSTGRFAIEDLEPRAYRVTFQKPAFETEVRHLTASEDAREERIDLRRGEGLALEARDGIYGTPLRGLFVRVVDAAGASVYAGSIPLDSAGHGEVPSLKPGSYELRVDSSGYAPVRRPVVVPSSALSLALTPGGALEIRVGSQTLGLPKPQGLLLDAGGQPYLTSIFSMDGTIPLGAPVRRIENVAPGRYVLAVEGAERHDLEVREGGATVVELP